MPHNIVCIEEAKLFVRVDHDVEDGLFFDLIDAATEAVLEYADGWVPDEDNVPARIKLAILCHVARAYSERQDGADIPEAAARLVKPMRRLSI